MPFFPTFTFSTCCFFKRQKAWNLNFFSNCPELLKIMWLKRDTVKDYTSPVENCTVCVYVGSRFQTFWTKNRTNNTGRLGGLPYLLEMRLPRLLLSVSCSEKGHRKFKSYILVNERNVDAIQNLSMMKRMPRAPSFARQILECMVSGAFLQL